MDGIDPVRQSKLVISLPSGTAAGDAISFFVRATQWTRQSASLT
jgi:hypothetical protein